MSRTGPLELLRIDHLLTEEERDIQATVREFVERRVKPNIADWYERGDLDLGLMREAGDLGLLGMHLQGYGCAGANAVSYGLACLDLEVWERGAEDHLAAPYGHRRGHRLLRADRARLWIQPGRHADSRQAGRRG